jgi:hypothetical protein
MKIIREFLTETNISEATENGKKHLYIEGIFLQSAIKNRNVFMKIPLEMLIEQRLY